MENINVLSVQDLVNFCKENSISTDTIIMLDMNEEARPFTSRKLNNSKDGKAEPIIELV